MAFVHLDPSTVRHPKLLKLAERDRWRWLQVVCWAVENSTDGIVSASELHRSCISRSCREARTFVARLHEAGLLDLIDGDPDRADAKWQLHDFLDYQTPAETVDARRKANAERQRRYRERNGSGPSGAAKRKGKTTGGRNAVTKGAVTPSRKGGRNGPLPSPPPLRGGEGGEAEHTRTSARPAEGRSSVPAGDARANGSTIPEDVGKLAANLAASLKLEPDE